MSSPEDLLQLPVLQTDLRQVESLSLSPPPVAGVPQVSEGVGVQLGPDIHRGTPGTPHCVWVQQLQYLSSALQQSAKRVRVR